MTTLTSALGRILLALIVSSALSACGGDDLKLLANPSPSASESVGNDTAGGGSAASEPAASDAESSGASASEPSASDAASAPASSASDNTAATSPEVDESHVTSAYRADMGDGTFRNPILYADAPDSSAVKVGGYYYLATASFQLMPGVPILRSADLVNWELVSYVFEAMNSAIPGFDSGSYSDAYNLQQGKSSYGQGILSPSLKYHNGLFFSVMPSLDQGTTYVCTHPAAMTFGDWTCSTISGLGYTQDPDLFFDDDGKVYLFFGNCYVAELNADARSVKSGGINQRLFDGGSTHGGNRVFKRNGTYYVLAAPVADGRNGWERIEVAWRSTSITGTWESRTILDDVPNYHAAIVDDGSFQWAVLFADAGPVGRIPKLTPVTWVDDWPILGVNGKVPAALAKPVQGGTVKTLDTTDLFNQSVLGHQWQWNHNPDNARWSLTDRTGWLRLKTAGASSLYDARNTLTQRGQGPLSQGWVKLDTSQLRDGQIAGISAFQAKYGYIAVRRTGTTRSIVQFNVGDGSETSTPLNQDVVYLKVNFDFTANTARFLYSADQQSWSTLGSALPMAYFYTSSASNNALWFTGYRFALFNYTTGSDTTGYADFGFFKFTDTND